MRVACHRIARSHSRIAECQDWCAVSREKGLVAVADGVSETLFAGRWARILVEGFVSSPPAGLTRRDFSAWAGRRRDEMASFYDRWEARARADQGEVPWAAREKYAEKSAAATFMGVRLRAFTSQNIQAQSFGIGDTCLFLFRERKLVHSSPAGTRDEFGCTPDQINAVADRDVGDIRTEAVDCVPGDRIVIATDGVAPLVFAAARGEQDFDLGRLLEVLGAESKGDREFRRLVRRGRAAGLVDDDDATAVLVSLRRPLTSWL